MPSDWVHLSEESISKNIVKGLELLEELKAGEASLNFSLRREGRELEILASAGSHHYQHLILVREMEDPVLRLILDQTVGLLRRYVVSRKDQESSDVDISNPNPG